MDAKIRKLVVFTVVTAFLASVGLAISQRGENRINGLIPASIPQQGTLIAVPTGESACDNGVDDEGDGLTDCEDPDCEAAVCATGLVGQCSATGICSSGSCIADVGPSPETCDLLDNDCNGIVDDNVPEEGIACGEDEGECSFGATSCIAGVLECVGSVEPSSELCDGLDNDCDGVVDNDPEGVGEVCGSAVGECSEGTSSCVDGAIECTGSTEPVTELCDQLDNDCDGEVDEEGVCDPVCGDATCSPGEEQGGAFECEEDCGPFTQCGNGECELGEDPDTCPEDCHGAGSCGDGICDAELGEDFETCPEDCEAPDPCGDGVCDEEAGEDHETCPADCEAPDPCGDGVCDAESGEDHETCPEDCEAPDPCGDGVCDEEAGEDHETCPADCEPPNLCGNGVCDGALGEDEETCPEDCGPVACEAQLVVDVQEYSAQGRNVPAYAMVYLGNTLLGEGRGTYTVPLIDENDRYYKDSVNYRQLPKGVYVIKRLGDGRVVSGIFGHFNKRRRSQNHVYMKVELSGVDATLVDLENANKWKVEKPQDGQGAGLNLPVHKIGNDELIFDQFGGTLTEYLSVWPSSDFSVKTFVTDCDVNTCQDEDGDGLNTGGADCGPVDQCPGELNPLTDGPFDGSNMFDRDGDGCSDASGFKMEALTELEEALMQVSGKEERLLSEARDSIQMSLGNLHPEGDDRIEWLDDQHLACKHGNKVFDHERHAFKLVKQTIKRDESLAVELGQVVVELVSADRQLAEVAVDESDLEWWAKRKLQSGLKKCLTEKNPNKAINACRDVWMKAACSGHGHDDDDEDDDDDDDDRDDKKKKKDKKDKKDRGDRDDDDDDDDEDDDDDDDDDVAFWEWVMASLAEAEIDLETHGAAEERESATFSAGYGILAILLVVAAMAYISSGHAGTGKKRRR